MRRARSLPGLAASVLFLSSCGVYTATEPSNRTTLKITVTRCDLGGSVDLVVDGLQGPYPTLPTPGEITMRVGPGPHRITYRRNDQDLAENIPGDPLETLRHLGPGEVTRIATVDPPWACLAVSGARSAGAR